MEHQINDQKCVAAGKRAAPSHARQSAKLRDMMISDNPNFSYADSDHTNTRRLDNAAPTHVCRRKSQVLQKMSRKEDELVRYMSNLPSFLENGKNLQEKALNVGVLDWKRLEQWRHSQKTAPHKHNECSPSSSNTSLFSTDGSSTPSSQGPSCSPANQRMHGLSLQSPFEASPEDAKFSSSIGHSYSPVRQRPHDHVLQSHSQKVYAQKLCDVEEKSQEVDVVRRNTGKFLEPNDRSTYCSSRQQKALGPLQHHGRKSCDLKSPSKMGQQPVFDKFEVMGIASIEKIQSKKGTLKSQKTKLNAANQDFSGIEESSEVVMPRNQSETTCSGVTTSSYFTVNDRFSVESAPKNFTWRKGSENSRHSDINGHKCSVGLGSQDTECIKNPSQDSKTLVQTSETFHDTSKCITQVVKGPSQASHTFSFPATRRPSSSSRSRNAEDAKPVTGIISSTTAVKTSEGDVRRNSESISNTRHSSPIRRLSFVMTKMIKNTGSRDDSPFRGSSSKDCVAKSGSKEATGSASIDSPCGDKSSGDKNNIGRSSPRRRLLDPFLKSKVSNSSEPSKKYSSAGVGSVKLCSDQIDFCNSVKVKSRSASSSTTSVSDPRPNSKNESIQALLQVSFKNGFPLLTFAIDNESDVLAATVRKSFVPAKGHHNWTYTFFSVTEIKTKSGIWFSKGNNHGFVPNVVAQMKVSDSKDSPFGKCGNAESHIIREFDLFAVNIEHVNQNATDLRPTNELAAIIAKLPRICSEDHIKSDQVGYNWLHISNSCVKEAVQEVRSRADSDDNFRGPHFPKVLDFNTTVILPGGVHTVPSKGEISTLIHRWRSGGTCDCGGWDLGCQLLVYTNKREHEKQPSSSVTCQKKDMFQLFSQGGQEDSQTTLSLAPFKEQIYSVEFSSSLSLLQAFAICISFLDCKRPAEVSEANNNVVEKISDEIGIFQIPSQTKTLNEVDATGRYISHPPHSPVGRV